MAIRLPQLVSAIRLPYPTRHPRRGRTSSLAGRLFSQQGRLASLKSLTLVVKESMGVKGANGFLEGRFPEGLKEVLRSVASEWGDVAYDVAELKILPMKGAMTNEVYQMIWPVKSGELVRKVLVRIYGDGVDVFFNRDDEIRTFECMSRHGQGPRLLGRFPDGRVEEFIHARTLSAADLRDPEISSLIATKMREFHSLDLPWSKNVLLWNRMRDWVKEAKTVCLQEDAKEFRFDILEFEINTLECELSRDGQEIGFCHNDLQYGNIMMDEDTKSITFIDYEYASYNPIAYDLANHFCEMAADYHSEQPHVLDYTKYPEVNERRRFVYAYLSSAGNEPSEDEVEQLIDDIEKYTLVNHLFWGLWGIISGYVNKIDFDYTEYARQRFQQYWQRKHKLLGCSGIVYKYDVDGCIPNCKGAKGAKGKQDAG